MDGLRPLDLSSKIKTGVGSAYTSIVLFPVDC